MLLLLFSSGGGGGGGSGNTGIRRTLWIVPNFYFAFEFGGFLGDVASSGGSGAGTSMVLRRRRRVGR